MSSARAADIARMLGGAKRNSRGWLAQCCCHKDRVPSLSLCDGDDGRLLVHCFGGCDWRDILAELLRRGWIEDRESPRSFHGKPRPRKPEAAPETVRATQNKTAGARRIWREASDPRGTLAERYLNRRGLELSDSLCGSVLRFHAGIKLMETDEGISIFRPALIVAFRPVLNDEETEPPTAIHRVFLNPDGSKIEKKMLGPVTGCAIKLDADETLSHGLGVCEGLETALAVRATGWRPVWAVGSAGAIAKLAPIPGIACLTIFADHDESGKGTEDAIECAHTWQAAGHEVTIRTPHTMDSDWLDVS